METILIELLAEAPVAAVSIYAIWRISLVMETLAKTLETIAISQNATVGNVVNAEMKENANLRDVRIVESN